MQYKITDLDISTADAENVQLEYQGGDLSLKFTDWQEHTCKLRFIEVLAFRWEDEFDTPGIRDDSCYLVEGSPWLARQAELAGEDANHYVHYKLCFNTCGVLDVVCKP
ncbi:MAG: hypothetical protein AAGH99_12455 [Planctomycetota bacterium]